MADIVKDIKEEKVATTKATTASKATKKDDGLVELYIPRGAKEDANYVIIGLNGLNYKIKRGETVRVPKGVKKIWDNAEAMINEGVDYEDEAQKVKGIAY